MKPAIVLFLSALLLTACNFTDVPSKSTEFGTGSKGDYATAASTKDDDDRIAAGENAANCDSRQQHNVQDENSFEIDCVKLFPGTTIKLVNASADDKRSEAFEKIAFTSPAAADDVMEWYYTEFAKKDIRLSFDGLTLSGTSKSGTPFTVEMIDGDDKKTIGIIPIKRRKA